MTELPRSWSAVPIGALCTLINGRAFKPEDWGTKGLPIIRIQNLNNPDAPFNRFAGDVAEKFLVEDGELLFAWSGTPGTSFGAHIWNRGTAILNQHIFRVLYDDEAVDRDYFKHAINHRLEELIFKAHGGVGLRHVTKGKFEETEIPLPPLAEQRRIVAKLDRVMARTARARGELARIPALIAHHKRAILAAAFDGTLTADWRHTHNLPPPECRSLAEVVASFTYGTSARSSDNGSVPVLRMGNIRDGKLDWTDLVFTSDQAEIDKYRLKPGDVLFNRTNSPELVGKTAVYRGEREAIFAGYLIRVSCGERLEPGYLGHCLNSPQGRAYCWRVKSDGVSQSNINAKKLGAFVLPVPSMEEQREIVRRIESAFAWLDKVAHEHAQASRLLDHLDQALLAKAFRGELVPQDPGDEPAAALLARIRAERANAAPAARKRRATP